MAYENDSEKLFKEANVLLLAGKSNEAEKIFREILRLDPNSNEALLGLGIALNQQGKEKEAVESVISIFKPLQEKIKSEALIVNQNLTVKAVMFLRDIKSIFALPFF